MRGATEHNRRMRTDKTFLLTRPMRGATLTETKNNGKNWNFYSHAPCGARRKNQGRYVLYVNFYSHAPCGARRVEARAIARINNFYSHAPCGARRAASFANQYSGKFLLTRPMRGATVESAKIDGEKIISTHTPHAGRDETRVWLPTPDTDFYSHAPCGARPGRTD